jgi:hypothetical protein
MLSMLMEEIYSRKNLEIEDMGCGTFIKCKSCGWFPEQEHSHLIYGNTNCEFIKSHYNAYFNNKGELCFFSKIPVKRIKHT